MDAVREPMRRGVHGSGTAEIMVKQGSTKTGGRFDDFQLLIGLFLLSLDFVQVGGAHLSQLWAVMVLPLLFIKRSIHVTGREVLVYALFMAVAVLVTLFAGYPHTKEIQQIIKFSVVYPGFFLIGRHFGSQYLRTRLPYGYAMLIGFLLFQLALQKLEIPVLYEKVDFMQDAIHGSFGERNWFAFFFFATSYVLFLQSSREPADVVRFLAFGVANALLSESKTVLIPCGIVMLTQVKGYNGIKLLLLAAGGALYFYRFGGELSGDLLRVRIEEERGLAFTTSLDLAEKDWLGYGFGFVENYFSNLALGIKGLGSGTNSIFCAPLDLMLIAGVPGVIAWLVFFCGVGLGWSTVLLLAPIAAWSLTNPMHQSEGVYLLIGYLVSWGRGMQPAVDRAALNQHPRAGHFVSAVETHGDPI
jgi:hypothetical protein